MLSSGLEVFSFITNIRHNARCFDGIAYYFHCRGPIVSQLVALAPFLHLVYLVVLFHVFYDFLALSVVLDFFALLA